MNGRWRDVLFFAVVAGSVYGLKRHYQSAEADALTWVLGPTAALVERLSGKPFELEPGAGYLQRESRFLLAPVCAGVNFLAAAFLTGCVGFFRRQMGWLERVGLLLGAAAAAYLVTVVANSARVLAALQLRGAWAPGLSAEAAHRLLGVGVYSVFLGAAFALAQRLLVQREGVDVGG